MPWWGASAKGAVGLQSKGGAKTQGGVSLQRVGSKRKGFQEGGVKTQKDEPKPVLMRSNHQSLYKDYKLFNYVTIRLPAKYDFIPNGIEHLLYYGVGYATDAP